MVDEKRYSVYKLECPHTRKVYIGVTCQKPEHRWRNGKAYHGEIRNDILKYGWDCFDKTILESGLNCASARQAEKNYISQYGKLFELYNETCGGEILSDSAISKRAESLKGRTIPPETREHMSSARKGIKFSESHLKNLSESHKGNQSFWEGKHRDKNTCEAISKSLSKRPIRCVETGEVFANLREASEKTGYPVSCISKWCNGVKSKHCPYTFERSVDLSVSQF